MMFVLAVPCQAEIYHHRRWTRRNTRLAVTT